MLQSNSYTGLLFLIGIFYNSMLFGWAVLLGTTASTATAVLLEVDRSQVRAAVRTEGTVRMFDQLGVEYLNVLDEKGHLDGIVTKPKAG